MGRNQITRAPSSVPPFISIREKRIQSPAVASSPPPFDWNGLRAR
jgi:hypothetical protein